MNIEQVIRLFENPRKIKNGYMVECSIHKDDTQSLHIKEDDGKLLLKCFAGCDTSDIFKFINGKDIPKTLNKETLRQLAGQKKDEVIESKWDKVFDYTDKDGKTVFQEVRFLDIYKSGKIKKRISYRRPSTQEEFEEYGIEWNYTLQGVKRIPYNFKWIYNHAEKGSVIYLTEGPKAAQYLIDKGYPASTIGGSTVKWTKELADYFTGLKIVLFPDNDKPGYKHMLDAVIHLKSVANLKVVFLPGLEEKGDDIYDWFESYGGTKIELKGIIENLPEIDVLNQEELEKLFTFPENNDFPQTENTSVQENNQFTNNEQEQIVNDPFDDFLAGLEKETENCSDMFVGLCPDCKGSNFEIKLSSEGIEVVSTTAIPDTFKLKNCNICQPIDMFSGCEYQEKNDDYMF